MSATTHTPSRGRLWKHRAFMLFWSGETVSLFGTQVTLLALPLTAVLTLNATASQLGFIRFVEQLPYLLFTLLFGAWVDRRRRRPVMILANSARALLIVLVPLFAVFGLLQLWLLAAIAFAVGIFTVLFDLTWLAYVPTLITSDEFVEANGKVATSASAAEVAGPGLGGLLVQLLSAPVALLADAASYVVSTITLVAIRAPEPAPHVQPGQRGRLLRDIGVGIGVVWRNLNLRAIMVMSGLWNMLFSIADTVFVLYAVRELHLGAGTLGAIYAVGAIGGLIGAASLHPAGPARAVRPSAGHRLHLWDGPLAAASGGGWPDTCRGCPLHACVLPRADGSRPLERAGAQLSPGGDAAAPAGPRWRESAVRLVRAGRAGLPARQRADLLPQPACDALAGGGRLRRHPAGGAAGDPAVAPALAAHAPDPVLVDDEPTVSVGV